MEQHVSLSGRGWVRARTARETNSRSLSLSLSPLLDQWLNRIGVGEGGAESGSGG